LDLEVHTTHAAHAAAARRHAATARVLLRHFGHHGFGGDQKRSNRRCVLDRHANNLGRVDDALGDQVDIFAGLRVEAIRISFDCIDNAVGALKAPRFDSALGQRQLRILNAIFLGGGPSWRQRAGGRRR
jgi:hypothetical protein